MFAEAEGFRGDLTQKCTDERTSGLRPFPLSHARSKLLCVASLHDPPVRFAHSRGSTSSHSGKPNKKTRRNVESFYLVRMRGLEPPSLAALVPKTSVSTIPPHPRD